MILKFLSTKEPPFSSRFIDNISEISFRTVLAKSENDLKPFKIRYFLGEKKFPVKFGLISYLRDDKWVQIAFQENCYLLNDSGDTIERFQV